MVVKNYLANVGREAGRKCPKQGWNRKEEATKYCPAAPWFMSMWVDYLQGMFEFFALAVQPLVCCCVHCLTPYCTK